MSATISLSLRATRPPSYDIIPRVLSEPPAKEEEEEVRPRLPNGHVGPRLIASPVVVFVLGVVDGVVAEISCGKGRESIQGTFLSSVSCGEEEGRERGGETERELGGNFSRVKIQSVA